MLFQARWREGVKEEKSRPVITSCKDPLCNNYNHCLPLWYDGVV